MKKILVLLFVLGWYPGQHGFAIPNAANSGELSYMHKLAKFYVEFSQEARTWLEGYHQSISGPEIRYHSCIPNITDALISRATNGTMRISWKTAKTPEKITNPHLSFVWLAGLGCNLGEKSFELWANEQKWLTFRSGASANWQIQGQNGVTLSFHSVLQDAANDLFGFMILTVPQKMVLPDASLHLSVVGESASSNAWYMTFKSAQVVEALVRTGASGFWYKMSWQDASPGLEIQVPVNWAGKVLRLQDPSGLNWRGTIQKKSGLGTVALKTDGLSLENARFPVQIWLDNRQIDRLDSLGNYSSHGEIFQDGLLVFRSWQAQDGLETVECSGSYFMDMVRSLEDASASYFAAGTIHLITSSHQDIAWMDAPEACVADRDTMILTPALELLARDPGYHYSVEQALMLKEYLERHPERYDEILQYSLAGRLEWGATYNQPYEGLYSGESLIRQLYFGRKWLQKTLPGYDSRLAWNVDVPGRTRQMAQILKKSGVRYLIISRHEPGLYYWASPDGSHIGVFSPGHYHHASEFMRQGTFQILAAVPKFMADWQPFYQRHRIAPELPVLVSTDMGRPEDFDELLKNWNRMSFSPGADQVKKQLPLPAFRYNIAEDFMNRVFASQPSLPVIAGERPNVWLYIHGPTHHHAISASRQAAKLLTAAEKFTTISAILSGTMAQYPALRLSRAWESSIYPDHGWGGKNGFITDSTFQAKYEFARAEAEQVLKQAQMEIAGRIRVPKTKALPIVVFNDLSYPRHEPVVVALSLAPTQAQAIEMTDANGRSVPSQSIETARHSDGSIQNITLQFIAEVPAIGYQTYFARIGKKLQPAVAPASVANPIASYENAFYRIDFAPGGIRQIYDKALQQNLMRTDKFLAGELFTLRSEGNGAGEFAEVQQPTMAGFDRLANHQPTWRQVHDGSVATTFQLIQSWPHCKVEQKVIVYRDVKRIDFETALLDWDGTEYREFRLAFPLALTSAAITYEVPFGTVTVGQDEIRGAAGERYIQPASQVRPREVQDWIGASDARLGITLSSSVAVWDYADPTDDPVDYPLLQPILLASRRSCHGEGNWYLQQGDHYYRFSLASHAPGWQNGYQAGLSANTPLRAVVAGESTRSGNLPLQKSFCSSAAANVLISTIKKCEDDDDIIIRCYEITGVDTETRLSWFTPIQKAASVDLIEAEALEANVTGPELRLGIGHHAIETLKIKIQPFAKTDNKPGSIR